MGEGSGLVREFWGRLGETAAFLLGDGPAAKFGERLAEPTTFTLLTALDDYRSTRINLEKLIRRTSDDLIRVAESMNSGGNPNPLGVLQSRATDIDSGAARLEEKKLSVNMIARALGLMGDRS